MTVTILMARSSLRELQNAPDAIPESGVEPPPLDTAWVEATRKKALLKLEKLDTDLKNYKGNSIKESIRRGHDDLGDHYLDCGDLSNALKCYSRARDYCTSAKHVINMCLNVIKVGLPRQAGGWGQHGWAIGAPRLTWPCPLSTRSASTYRIGLMCSAMSARLSLPRRLLRYGPPPQRPCPRIADHCWPLLSCPTSFSPTSFSPKSESAFIPSLSGGWASSSRKCGAWASRMWLLPPTAARRA